MGRWTETKCDAVLLGKIKKVVLEAIDHESRAGCKERITYETFVKNLVEDDVSITDPMQNITRVLAENQMQAKIRFKLDNQPENTNPAGLRLGSTGDQSLHDLDGALQSSMSRLRRRAAIRRRRDEISRYLSSDSSDPEEEDCEEDADETPATRRIRRIPTRTSTFRPLILEPQAEGNLVAPDIEVPLVPFPRSPPHPPQSYWSARNINGRGSPPATHRLFAPSPDPLEGNHDRMPIDWIHYGFQDTEVNPIPRIISEAAASEPYVGPPSSGPRTARIPEIPLFHEVYLGALDVGEPSRPVATSGGSQPASTSHDARSRWLGYPIWPDRELDGSHEQMSNRGRRAASGANRETLRSRLGTFERSAAAARRRTRTAAERSRSASPVRRRAFGSNDNHTDMQAPARGLQNLNEWMETSVRDSSTRTSGAGVLPAQVRNMQGVGQTLSEIERTGSVLRRWLDTSGYTNEDIEIPCAQYACDIGKATEDLIKALPARPSIRDQIGTATTSANFLSTHFGGFATRRGDVMYEPAFWDYLRTAVATDVGLSDFVSDVLRRDDHAAGSSRPLRGLPSIVASSAGAAAPAPAVASDVPTASIPAAADGVPSATSGPSALAAVDVAVTASTAAGPVEPATENDRVQHDGNLESQAATLLGSTSDLRESVMRIIDSSRDLVNESGRVMET